MNNANVMASLRGLREDDARVSLDGLREDDAGISLQGLREDDAGISLEGLREDDAAISLGKRRRSILKTVAKKQPYGQAYRFIRKDIKLDGLREDDAGVSLEGLREDDAMISMNGLREDDARVSMDGLREDDAGITLGEMEIGQITHDSLGRAFIKRIPNAVAFRQVKTDLRLKRGRPAVMMTAQRHGLPVAEIKGTDELAGFWDFLKRMPSDEEYLAKIRLVISRWVPAHNRLHKLTEQQREAILNNMIAAKADHDRYDGLTGFLKEGAAAKTTGRWDRIVKLDTYLPTLEKLLNQAEQFGSMPTPEEEQKKVNQTSVEDVILRQEAVVKESLLVSTVLPVAAGGAALGLVYLLVKAVA